MDEPWDQKDAHIWTAYREERYLPTFRFTWFYESKYLGIEIDEHNLGTPCYAVAKKILERLKHILGDDGAGMAGFTGETDGTTQIYRTYDEGQEWPKDIQLHAYVEMRDDHCQPFKLTLDEALAFHDALEEVFLLIEEGYEGDEPWCLCREESE